MIYWKSKKPSDSAMKHAPSLCLHWYLMIVSKLSEQLTVFSKEADSAYVVRKKKNNTKS